MQVCNHSFGWKVPVSHGLHDSFRVGTFWYDPAGHGWYLSELEFVLFTHFPTGHSSFDGRADGEEEIDGEGEGHVSPNGIDFSSTLKFPPSLIRTESNIEAYKPFPVNKSQHIPSPDKSFMVST